MKTLYITDLDGTLLTNKAGLKDRAAEMIKRLSSGGALISYATARRFQSAGFIMQKAEIALPVITMNGVIIADGKSGEVIKLNGFAEGQTAEALRVIEEYGETPLVYAFVDGVQRVSYLEGKTDRIKTYISDRGKDNTLRPCSDYKELFRGDIHYFTFINTVLPDKVRAEVFSREKGFETNSYFDVYHKNELWYEVFSSKASKSNAVLQLKEMLGADETVCFGDNTNDISMFKVSDRCYAVSNAVDELKAIATSVIGSNENISVPVFIERERAAVFEYKPHESVIVQPDGERFQAAVEKAKAREKTNIGTLNEKCIHSALKNYYSDEFDQEAKIGSFYADIVAENGIFEIQTANFKKLVKKLEVMLSVCHVTVVYPLEKRTRVIAASDTSGEVLREGGFRYNNSLSGLFLELYRIKSFLTDPNLTVCIAELDVERVNYVSEKTGRRRKRGAYTKTPLKLRREIYLEKPSDYGALIPPHDGLPEEFTVSEFQGCVKPTDARLMLEILLYMGAADKAGKRGNAELYRLIY
ncbi:MAG: Cof-type HAD-IIB family hydrolase [Bacteroides sp.]|nr:Cof-type HAD-IIB family hydrolase [Bacteroides sp.]